MKAESSQFIPQALRVINDAVIGVIGMTDLHVRKTQLSKRLASRASVRLRALEKMLRSVISLMALAMAGQVHSTPKMLARIRVIGAAPTTPLPPRTPQLPRARMPGLPCFRASGCHVDFHAFQRSGPRNSVSLQKLAIRIITLQRILKNPEPKARRLAFYYARLKRKKTMPAPLPDIAIKRAPAELALIAGALPIELRRAFAVWHDTS